MNKQFKVSNLWAQRLQEHQVSLPSVMRRRRAGLPAGFFQQEKICVTTPELFALWRAVGETSSGDPAIGLKLGAEARLERHDPAAITAVCSRSLRDAVQRIAFYKHLAWIIGNSKRNWDWITMKGGIGMDFIHHVTLVSMAYGFLQWYRAAKIARWSKRRPANAAAARKANASPPRSNHRKMPLVPVHL